MTADNPQAPARALEEELEFSNVTDMRQNLLRKIDDLQTNPAARVLILKHGRPLAVLMSSETYDVLKKVVEMFLAQASGLTRAQSIEAAIRRFEAERSTELAAKAEKGAEVTVAAG